MPDIFSCRRIWRTIWPNIATGSLICTTLGECEVKHGLRLHLVNLYKDGLGNPACQRNSDAEKGGSKRPMPRFGQLLLPGWPKWSRSSSLCLLSAVALAISSLIFLQSRATSTITADYLSKEKPLLAAIPEKSIAVLPFENLSDEKENAYFADGVQDEILTGLAKVADLKVISRTSVMQYKTGAKRNLREIAQALGVAHVLEGSVQRAGDRVRVSAQLIDARTDTHLWAERYDRDLADVFAIQSEIGREDRRTASRQISPSEKAAIEQAPTTDLAGIRSLRTC